VQRVNQGEAAFFRRDTWHHAFNYSDDLLQVLEFFAPPPSQGTSGAYSQQQPMLKESKYTRDQWLGWWPMARADVEAEQTIQVLRETDCMWRLEGRENEILVGLWAATEHLTVGKIHLLPGQHSDLQAHGGDESLYLLEGRLNMHVPQNEGQRWFELNPGDGFYVPEGEPHSYYNMTGQPLTLIFGVAPRYLVD
jgi:quercetin dioxygenase-like cupin family protein